MSGRIVLMVAVAAVLGICGVSQAAQVIYQGNTGCVDSWLDYEGAQRGSDTTLTTNSWVAGQRGLAVVKFNINWGDVLPVIDSAILGICEGRYAEPG